MKVFSNKKILLSILTAFVAILPFVYGANVLDQIFKPFAGTNIGATYLQYATFIDAILYFWLFIALSNWILGSKDSSGQPRFGGAVPTVIGVMLGIGMSVFEYTSKFNLGMLGPLAAIIFFLVLGAGFVIGMKKLGANFFVAFSLTFIIIYTLINTVSPSLEQWIENAGMLGTIWSTLFLVSIIGLIYGIVKLISNIKTGQWKKNRIAGEEGETEHNEKRLSRAEKKALKAENKAEQDMLNIERGMNTLNQQLPQLESMENELKNKDILNRKEQIQYLQQLYSTIGVCYKLQQEMTDVYKNIANPAYADKREQINERAKQLDQFIATLRNILTKLESLMTEASRNDDTFKSLEQQYENTSQAMKDDLQRLSDVIKKFTPLKLIDENIYNQLAEKLRKDPNLQPLIEIYDRILILNNTVNTNQTAIADIDRKNLDDLRRVITLTEKRSTDDLGVLYRSLKFYTAEGKEEVISNFKDKKYLQAFVSGYKYLSPQSIKQVSEAVQAMYKNAQQASGYADNRDTALTEKIELTKKYTNLTIQFEKNTKDDINGTVDSIKKEYGSDIITLKTACDILGKIYNTLNTILPTLHASMPPIPPGGLYAAPVDRMNNLTQSLNRIRAMRTSLASKMKNPKLKTILAGAIDHSQGIVNDLSEKANVGTLEMEKEYKILEKDGLNVLNGAVKNLIASRDDATKTEIEINKIQLLT
jgi:hypothetical protein